jgi:hypothetical protein
MIRNWIVIAGFSMALAGGPLMARDIVQNVGGPSPAAIAKQDGSRLAMQQARPAKSQTTPVASRSPKAQIEMPSREAMVIMIRSSLLALSQANQTNNYAVLNALGSDSFRANNSPARLSETFSAFRANNIDLAPVAMINPQLTAQPAMVDGRLRLIGNFPTQPMQVNFDLTYEPTQAGWKIFGIAVNLNRVPQPAQTSKAAPATPR